MKLWDWAALVAVVEGAGGRVTDWSGRPLTPGGDGRVLAVGDPPAFAAHRLASQLLRSLDDPVARLSRQGDTRGPSPNPSPSRLDQSP